MLLSINHYDIEGINSDRESNPGTPSAMRGRYPLRYTAAIPTRPFKLVTVVEVFRVLHSKPGRMTYLRVVGIISATGFLAAHKSVLRKVL